LLLWKLQNNHLAHHFCWGHLFMGRNWLHKVLVSMKHDHNKNDNYNFQILSCLIMHCIVTKALTLFQGLGWQNYVISLNTLYDIVFRWWLHIRNGDQNFYHHTPFYHGMVSCLILAYYVLVCPI
jgi:hypothetical protein